VEGDGGGHEALAVGGDAVEALSGELGDESVAAQFADLPGDVGAAAAGFPLAAGRLGVEAAA
jgi:hypothetical protein